MTTTLAIDIPLLRVGDVANASSDCVLDLDGFGRVLGVEILDLGITTGWRPTGPHGIGHLSSGEEVRWSYDNAIDALYVTIQDDRSIDQRSARCAVEGTGEGRARITVRAGV